MSSLSGYQAVLKQVLAERKYVVGKSAKGVYAAAQKQASERYHRSQGTTKTTKAVSTGKKIVRQKLEGALHSCAGLSEDPCVVAPNCVWQPKAKRCMTNSGKPVVGLFHNKKRDNLMKSLRGQQVQQQQEGGRYWF